MHWQRKRIAIAVLAGQSKNMQSNISTKGLEKATQLSTITILWSGKKPL